MRKLYTLNICLFVFIFIFLFHFTSSKERFFFIFNGSEKYEIALNRTSYAGKSFYKILKENKTIPLIFTYFHQEKIMMVNLNLHPENGQSQSGDIRIGEIIYIEMSTIGEGLLAYLYIFAKNYPSDSNNFDRVGNIIQTEGFNKIINSLNPGNQASYPCPCQFLLVEEKDYTARKKKKSGDWKTVKIMKKFKALKRYRIMKRLTKLKGQKN